MPDRQLTKALVVHTQPTAPRLVKVVLEASAYDLTFAQGEAAGLRLFYALRPAVVILVLSPEWDGVSIAQDIRLCCDVPLLFLTASPSHPWGKRTACVVLHWPATPQALLAALAHLLPAVATVRHNHRKRVAERTQKCGDFILDPAQRQVLVQGSFVKLTPHEYELLVYLMQTAGHPVAAYQILKHVWGSDHTGHHEYIHTYVWRLRNKIEPDPSHPRYLLSEYHDGFYLATE